MSARPSSNHKTATQAPTRAGSRAANWWHHFFPRFDSEKSTFGLTPWRMLETAVLVLLALAMSFRVWPEDIFGIHSQFPWLWIVPAVLAMRYGSGIGVLAVVMMLASWLLAAHYGDAFSVHLPTPAFPKNYFLGGLILTLLCGQFSEVWNVRIRRVRAINAYLDERLTTLTKNHFLLRLSHERLEQDQLSKPLTLRESLERLRAIMVGQQTGPFNPLPGADAFLQILMQSCQLEVASVHACLDGAIVPKAIAMLGEATPLEPGDPMLTHSLQEEKLTHLQSAGMHQAHFDISHYMICAPLKNFDDTIFGVLLIEKMPFVALNDDMLQLLSVLIDYYADGLEMSKTAHGILQEVPGCPPELATDVVRLQRLNQTTGIESALVALVFRADGAGTDIYEQIKRLKRAADVGWAYSGPDNHVLITLLPLAGPAAVEGYLMRVETIMQAQFGSKFLTNYAQIHTAHMGRERPAEMLAELVRRCAV